MINRGSKILKLFLYLDEINFSIMSKNYPDTLLLVNWNIYGKHITKYLQYWINLPLSHMKIPEPNNF